MLVCRGHLSKKRSKLIFLIVVDGELHFLLKTEIRAKEGFPPPPPDTHCSQLSDRPFV